MTTGKLAGDDARRMLRAVAQALVDGDVRALRGNDRNLAVCVLRALADGDDPTVFWDRGALADTQRRAVRAVLRHAAAATSWSQAYKLAADELRMDSRPVKEHWLAWRKDSWPTGMPLPILKSKTPK
ncbi:hypothetical protein [Dokdonella sp.]|uniref:hypothetical protein n=1 Tax=Dokdonella sp. TaxID=2291710 RepID=UPI0037849BAE